MFQQFPDTKTQRNLDECKCIGLALRHKLIAIMHTLNSHGLIVPFIVYSEECTQHLNAVSHMMNLTHFVPVVHPPTTCVGRMTATCISTLALPVALSLSLRRLRVGPLQTNMSGAVLVCRDFREQTTLLLEYPIRRVRVCSHFCICTIYRT